MPAIVTTPYNDQSGGMIGGVYYPPGSAPGGKPTGMLPTVSATYGGVPNYQNLATTQSGNIAALLSPSDASLGDARRRGAEAAVGGGFQGSGFEDINTLHMSEDEKLRRQLLGSKMLSDSVGNQSALQAANLNAANLGERQTQYWQNRQDMLNPNLYASRTPILGGPTSPGVSRVGGAPGYGAAPGSRGTVLPTGNPLMPQAPSLPMRNLGSFGMPGTAPMAPGGSGIPIYDKMIKQYMPWATPSGYKPSGKGSFYSGDMDPETGLPLNQGGSTPGTPTSSEDPEFGIGPTYNDSVWGDLGIDPYTGLYS